MGLFLDRLATGCFWGEMYTRAWLFSILIQCCYRCLCFRGRFAPLCRPWGKYSSWKPSPSHQVRAGDTFQGTRIVCHQINKEHACPSPASWNVWGDLWSSFFQLNLSFPLIPELVQVLTNKWWSSVSPAALLRWTDMKNKTRCGKFQSAFLQVLPDQLVVCPDHYSCCDNSDTESSYLNFWFCFFCESCEYDFALLSNRQKAKYCIHVMSDSAFSSFSISTLKQCALCF